MLYLIDFERDNVLGAVLWFHFSSAGLGLLLGTLQLLAWRYLSGRPQPLSGLAVDEWAFVWSQPVLLIDIPWDERSGPPLLRHIAKTIFIYLVPVFSELCVIGALLGALADIVRLVKTSMHKTVNRILHRPETDY